MKVMLIDAPYKFLYGPFEKVFSKYPPYGLMQISSLLKNNGIEVQLIDPEIEGYDANSLANKIKQYQPDIIGISCMTSNLLVAYEIAKLIKFVNPDIFIILGGPHVSALPFRTLKECQYIDAICIGEGEYTILELAKKNPLKRVRGLAFRKNSRLVMTPPRPLIENLDVLPFPDFDSVPLKKYKPHTHKMKKHLATSILTSRGCPFSCYFCASHVINKRCYRYHSVSRVLDILSELVARGFTYFRILDDEFLLNKKRVKQICDKIIENRLKIIWDCNARVDNVNSEILKKMRLAGCQLITYGCESGNQRVLKMIRKGITVNQIRLATKAAWKFGIEVTLSWMLGHPWDDVNTINDTIKLAKSLDKFTTQHYFNFAIPLPGTLFWEIAKKTGRLSTNWNFYMFQNRPVYIPPNLSGTTLTRLMKVAYKEVFFSKNIILNRIKKITSLEELKGNFIGFISLMKGIREWSRK
jgi:radical SAM superfamily enzyme YgiQ (UPF0313 family)